MSENVGNLVIGAQVDKGTFSDDIDTVQELTRKAGEGIAISFQECSTKTRAALRGISDEVKTAADSVSAQSIRIAEATRAQSLAMTEVRLATRVAKDEQLNAADTARLLAAAQEKAALAAKELARAEEQLAVASEHVVTGQQAASGAIRSLEGNAGLRAVENFISKTLGLGPALQAIFPIIGAIAFGQVIFDLGEKLYELEQKAAHAAESTRAAFADLHDRAAVVNDDLAIQNDKLQDEIDKLSGHPNNGLATALDEARKMADQLLLSLQADRKELEGLLKDNDAGAFGSLLTGVASSARTASTGLQGKELLSDQKKLTEDVRKAKSDFEAAVAGVTDEAALNAAADRRNAAIRSAFQKQIETYKTESTRLRKEQSDSALSASMADGMGGQAGGLGSAIDNSKKIANIEGRAQQLQDALTHETYIESIAAKEQVVGRMKQGHEGAKAEHDAADEQLQAIEQEYQRLNAARIAVTGKPLTAGDGAAFWKQYLDTFREGSKQATKVLEEYAKAQEQMHKGIVEAVVKLAEKQKTNEAELERVQQQALRGQEEMGRGLQMQGEDVFRTGERWDGYNRAVTEGAVSAQRLSFTLQEGNIRFRESIGALTPLAAAQQLAALHTREHRIEIELLEQELRKLKEEGATLKPGDKGYEQNATRQQQVQNQIGQQKGSGKVQGQQDRQAIDQAVAQPYLRAFDHINQGWLRVQNDLIAGNKNIARDFAEMGTQLVQSLAQNFEKMIAKDIERELRSVLIHRAGNQAKVTDDIVSASESSAIARESALKQIFMDAKQSAAGAYKAVVGIPIIGPVLAPVAAATAFAGVMALESFNEGGVVSGVGGYHVPILAKQGERILTGEQNSKFEQMVGRAPAAPAAASGMGSPIHVHYAPTVHAQDRTGMRATLRLHSDDIVGIVRQAHKQGKLLA
jgi:hypothetical protein